ncbi:MAG TPA: hypothetical protein DDZ41_00650 [Flavobacterium sp.]|nr:hypothetical protein [Flavobacterium sp.]
MKTIKLNIALKKNVWHLIFLLYVNCFSQDYKNIEAYLNDFSKNEFHLNEKLSEYIIALKENHIESRVSTTVNTILLKLNNLNLILTKHDKGWNNDVELRNALINLNLLTIELIKNDTFNLTNYKEMSLLSTEEILRIFDEKEKKIHEYYITLKKYQDTKIKFYKKYKMNLIQTNRNEDILEYVTEQGLIFYQVGVIDAKFIVDIKSHDLINIEKTLTVLKQICQNVYIKNKLIKLKLKDTALQKMTDTYVQTIEKNNSILYTDFKTFFEKQEELKKRKELYKTSKISTEEYGAFVKNYNELKNRYLSAFDMIQKRKIDLVEDWYKSNSEFITNNIKLEKK